MLRNKLLRRFGFKRDEVTGEWRRLHNEELYALYSPDIIRVIKSRRMRWVGHVACMGREKVYTGFWWGNLMERDRVEEPSVDGRIILQLFPKKWHGVMEWIERAQDRQMAGSCECGNEPSVSIKCGKFPG